VTPPERVLVALDDRPAGRRALEYALNLAEDKFFDTVARLVRLGASSICRRASCPVLIVRGAD